MSPGASPQAIVLDRGETMSVAVEITSLPIEKGESVQRREHHRR